MQNLRNRYSADLAMGLLTLIWGFNFIVVKDAIRLLDPITFNAIRFFVGAVTMIPLVVHYRHLFKFTWRDTATLAVMTLFGSVIYQVLFVNSLKFTTSTNTALLVATMPTWTAAVSVGLGIVTLRRNLVLGLLVTFVGVALVILSRAEDGLSISHGDMVGGVMALVAAFFLGAFWVLSKPFIDRYGGLSNAIFKHWLTTFGLMVLALPDLVRLRPASFPMEVLPNIIFSGILASVGGYLITNYAIGKIGAVRTATYNNFSPLIAAVAGILVFGYPVPPMLVIGAVLVFAGIILVRRNTQTRRAPVMTPAARPAVVSPATGD